MDRLLCISLLKRPCHEISNFKKHDLGWKKESTESHDNDSLKNQISEDSEKVDSKHLKGKVLQSLFIYAIKKIKSQFILLMKTIYI
jgi:hypothetical protein